MWETNQGTGHKSKHTKASEVLTLALRVSSSEVSISSTGGLYDSSRNKEKLTREARKGRKIVCIA